MGNFTEQMNTFLETNRLKHEEDLENIRRSYCLSLDDLHTAASNSTSLLSQW